MLILVLTLAIGVSQGAEDESVSAPNPQAHSAQNNQPVIPPISVTIANPPKTEAEKAQEAQDRQDEIADRKRDVKAQEQMATFTKWLVALSLFQLIAAVAAVVAAWKAVVAAEQSTRVAKDSEKHFRATERAYVAINNTDEGWIIDEAPMADGDRQTSGTLVVTNTGNTPARITDAFLDFRVEITFPISYSRTNQRDAEGLTAYLVKGAFLSIPLDKTAIHAGISRVEMGEIPLWLCGFIDYVDVFGTRHRVGYARKIGPKTGTRDVLSADGDIRRQSLYALQWDRESSAYNYDKIREPGDGSDWDEQGGQQNSHTN